MYLHRWYGLLSSITLVLMMSAFAHAAPVKPTALSGTESGNSVNLTWSEQNDAAAFNIYQNDNYLTTVTGSSYSATVAVDSVNTFYIIAISTEPYTFSERSEQITVPESAVPADTTIPPSVPQALTGSISGTTVVLNWRASTDDELMSGYNIYENNNYLTTVFSTTYTGTVSADTAYVYNIVAFDSRKNFSAASDSLILPESTEPVDTTVPPTVPGSLTGSMHDSTVTLNWQPSTDDQLVRGYNVYQNNQYLTTVPGTTFTGNVVDGQRYTYHVIAFDNYLNFSPASQSISLPDTITRADTTAPPTMVTGLTGTLGNSDATVQLSWTAATDDHAVAGYNVYKNNSYLTTVADPQFSGPVQPGTANDFYVIAFDYDNNFASRSAILSLSASDNGPPDLTEDNQPPTIPAALSGTITSNGATSQVTLSWLESNDNRAVAGYNIYENNRYITTVGGISFSKSVTTGSIYSYYIIAFDNDSNYSQPSVRVTLPEGENRAPDFENFDDQTIFAGEQLALLIKPVDSDGDTPGLYTSGLPIGMRSVDNLNGTRTLQWRPLQPEVGVYDITATAIDSANTAIQTTKTIQLTVDLPADQSNIPNLPPSIDRVEEHVVRIGDTVVMEVKGTDPNGTVPELTILNLPSNATFQVRPDEPAIKVLRWTTTAEDFGQNDLHFKVVDAIDTSMTAQATVSLIVDNPANFERPGVRLRTLAEQRGIQIGYASLLRFFARPDSDLYQDIAKQEFNLMTTENSMKWGYINPKPGEYRWEAADAEVRFAAENDIAVHGHTLVWYAVLPQWVKDTPVQQLEGVMNEFIDTLTARYPSVAIWDVVNESLNDDGSMRDSPWYKAMGSDYIEKAFIRARAGTPDATLIYNDYDIAAAGEKADAAYALMQDLLNKNVPIDGIGFQMHVDTNFSRFDNVTANLQRFADLGLDLYITELDVSMRDGATDEQQGEIVERIASICLAQPRCKALQLWGFTDRYSWLEDFTPLMLDENYQPKPFYFGLQNALTGN